MEGQPKVLKSEIDPSVNFVWDVGPGEAIEARYVRRNPDYVACYLSTQTACEKACRMCHLTATGQNKSRDVSLYEMLEQSEEVLNYYYRTQYPENAAKVVHFNFMARGEPLASKAMLEYSQTLFFELGARAEEINLVPRFLVSTIMPETLNKPLVEFFPLIQPEIYYSLYSMRPEFRRRWLPRAMDPSRALQMLVDWQRHSKKIIRIHHALIEGENDDPAEVNDIYWAIREVGLRVDFTLVRYNPPSEKHGKESSRYEEYTHTLGDHFPESRIKTIQRVGFDVAASCGMFVS